MFLLIVVLIFIFILMTLIVKTCTAFFVVYSCQMNGSDKCINAFCLNVTAWWERLFIVAFRTEQGTTVHSNMLQVTGTNCCQCPIVENRERLFIMVCCTEQGETVGNREKCCQFPAVQNREKCCQCPAVQNREKLWVTGRNAVSVLLQRTGSDCS